MIVRPFHHPRFVVVLSCFVASLFCGVAGRAADFLVETAKEIPVIAEVDVLVVGGSSGAVSAACEAARHGARVFLIAPRPHLGDDLASTMRLWLEEGESLDAGLDPVPFFHSLAAACFGDGRLTTPLRVKAAMDRALLESSVRFLTGCYATDILRDEHGRIAGVVMANRSGRQAIRTRVVVDATDRAVVARLAEAQFRPFQSGVRTFTHVVIGGTLQSGEHVRGETKDFSYPTTSGSNQVAMPIHQYAIDIDLPDNRPGTYCQAEHIARDRTWTKGIERFSESLPYQPSDTIVGRKRIDEWPGAGQVELDAFRPRGLAGLYVLSAYADVSEPAGAALQRPLQQMELGARIGRQAALDAQEPPSRSRIRENSDSRSRIRENSDSRSRIRENSDSRSRIRENSDSTAPTAPNLDASLRIAENLAGIRALNSGTVDVGSRPLPILGRYDVVVVGGGTSGAPAAIAAAGAGAKTLVVESLHELGGVGTVGLIAAYWYGLRRGFTKAMDDQVNPGSDRWNAVEKAEWLRQELRRRGADIWFGTLGCGTVVDDRQVRGVVLATPWGRGVVLARTVIDATGNADIAAWAGAPTSYSISERGSLNVQIAGFPERPLSRWYVNTCYTMVDDTDVLDVWHLMVWRRNEFRNKPVFDVGQLIDSRDRRRIVGDATLTVPDILNGRTFPDTFSQHTSNFDAAAFPDSPLLLIADAKGPVFRTDVPYPCLLPQGLDGLLVVGLGCSAERDAMTLIRMQPDLQNQGYAAGLAAAEAARLGGSTRSVDIRALQSQLIREGLLDPRVHTDEDSYPLSDEAITRAVRTLADSNAEQNASLAALAVVLAHPDRAMLPLRNAYLNPPDPAARRAYAQILGVLGDPVGAPALIEAIEAHDGWDTGMSLTSQRKTGNMFSPLDRLVIALGLSRDADSLPALVAKLRQLRPDSELSHFKAIALALSAHLPCPDAVDPLIELLRQPGLAGHATPAPAAPGADRPDEPSALIANRLVTVDNDRAADRTNLNKAYKELIAAALLYHCGDRDGLGRATLQRYAQDIHGHLARYAEAALARQN
jgi:flavin-dependent dehydrogenase